MSNTIIGLTVHAGGTATDSHQGRGRTSGDNANSTQTSSGRGRTGGRGGRNNNRNCNRNNNEVKTTRVSTFKGNTAGMNGHVFEYYHEQSDKRQYAKTVEALEEHAKKTLKHSEDFASLFATDSSEPILKKPVDLDPGHSVTDEMIWKEEIKTYVSRLQILRGNLGAIFSTIMGQCSEAMKAKIKSLREFESRNKRNNCHWLLKNIQSITLKFDQKRNGYLDIMDAHQKNLNCKQGQDQTTEEYLETLTLWADTIEYHGGTFVENYKLAAAIDTDGNIRTDSERKQAARKETLAMALIRGADPIRFGTLLAELSNQYTLGRNNYPATISSAYGLLINYKTPTNASIRNRVHTNNVQPKAEPSIATTTNTSSAESSAMTFAQAAATTPPSDMSTIVTTQTGMATTLCQLAVMMAQLAQSAIDPNWVLLDLQSTISVFCNADMLSNVRPSMHTLPVITNGGHQDSDMIGEFPNLGTVWFNNKSIANILSLSDVRKVCKVTMDTSQAPAMHVHRQDVTIMSFLEHPSGLYVHDANLCPDTRSTFTAYSLLSTVANHKKLFSKRQISAADNAHTLNRLLGRPDEAEFESILRSNLIRNCPVTPDDAKRALLIYGPDIDVL